MLIYTTSEFITHVHNSSILVSVFVTAMELILVNYINLFYINNKEIYNCIYSCKLLPTGADTHISHLNNVTLYKRHTT